MRSIRLVAFWNLFLAAALAGNRLQADDWPQWGGPQRDLVWRESGIVQSLPAGRLPRVWTAKVGEGYAGPAVADGKVYLTDRIHGEGNDGVERVLCLDAESGDLLWKHEYECLYSVSYPAGPRATPLCHDRLVYTLGAVGHLFCLDAETGEIVWSRFFPDDFGTRLPTWGTAAAPLVDGDQLIALVGGPDALVVSFDRRTGKELWRALDDPGVGYCPPMIYDFDGQRQLIIWHPQAVSALDPRSGASLWDHRFPVQAGLTIATPRKHNNRLLVSSFYNGSLMLEVSSGGAEEVWRGKSDSEIRTDGLHALMGTPILTDTHIYGVGSYGQLRCLDADTGRRVWETFEATGEDRWWNAFLIPHEDRVFIHNEQGELIIARLTPEGYDEDSRALLIEPTRPVRRRMTIWSHPAFAMQSVFARNDKVLVRVNLAAE
ncbi:MAG: pyrrolo-quinoline quinone [Planctomycetota bacterium]|nr:MAG: pyrrolo-quinoline quinone [Planctomycetota bacterium]REJ95566.1 MAG: pyrrolo-quinoline quinone [Planctomycetota bacterium]REK21958.1 MAG: pyrrolo-quinoline quinone [Planctomycetota bacterium]REK32192.1 MAG: pyrrolo-quinoline quinone [Planctomycetota bacterium]